MKSRNTSWLAVAVVGILASGCYTTTFSVEQVPDTAHKHTIIRRSNASSPIESSWRQEKDALVGTLAWKKGCSVEEHTRIGTEQVKTVTADKKAYAALAVLGIGMSVAGVALMASASDLPSQNVCTDGHCTNARDEMMEGAGGLTGIGLGTTVGALAATSSKPVVTRTKISDKEQVRIVSRDAACGDLASLSGLRVSVLIPGTGRWVGEADKDGTLRIPLPESEYLPSEAIDLFVVVDEVPRSATSLLAPGDRIGRVRVSAPPKAQRANRQPTEQPGQRTRNPA